MISPIEPGQRLAVGADEAAALMGVSGRFLRQLAERGEIPHVRLGRRVLFPLPELRRWLSDATRNDPGDTGTRTPSGRAVGNDAA